MKTITIKLAGESADAFLSRATHMGLIQENADGDIIVRKRPARRQDAKVYPWHRRHHIRVAVRRMLAKRIPQEAEPKEVFKTIGLI